MADPNPIQPYNYGSDVRSEFDRKGHQGKFHRSITCTTGTTIFTGSNFGVGGLVVPSGCTGTASFSNGGTISLASLAGTNPRIYDFALESVKVDNGTVYALVRDHLIR